MSSYHSSFTYNNINTKDKGLIITSFEPDNGLKDTFLSMDPIYEDYYDGSKRFDYGSRYNTSATIQITVIKRNGQDFSVTETRSCLKWLTGIRTNSWLDMYIGDEIAYSFLAKCTNVQQQKMDARTIGLILTFTSVSPWAYSAPVSPVCSLFQLVYLVDDGEDADVVIKAEGNSQAFGYIEFDTSTEPIDEGVLCVSSEDNGSYFDYYEEDGVAQISNSYQTSLYNDSDDLYTYIYLDIEFENEHGTELFIINETLGERSIIKNMSVNEKINISAKQFITSSIDHKVFGDSFNFVWPRLAPGENKFIVDSDGRGVAKFTYRWPIKIGDCAMDVSVYGEGIDCGNCEEISSYDTIKWEKIINTPTTIGGYGITDAYTMQEVDAMGVKVDEQKLNDMLSDILG